MSSKDAVYYFDSDEYSEFRNSNHDSEIVKDFYKMGKSMLSVWGLWPIRNMSPLRSKLYKVYGLFIIMITMVPYNVFSSIDIVYQMREGNWFEIMPRLSVALAMLLGAVKVAVFAYNKSTIQQLMDLLEHPDYIYESTPFFHPNNIIRHCRLLYHVQTAVCFGLIGILIMTDVDTYLKEPILHSDNTTVYPLPFINWLPYDYSVTPFYQISFFFTNFWFFFCAYIIFVYDTICMGQMIHSAGHLKVIKLALMNLRSRAIYHLQRTNYNGRKLEESEINSTTKIMFLKCAKHHQAIIKFIKDFQGLYSIIIFLQFFISCLMICFTILIVTNSKSPMSSRVTCLIILLCSMWELSVYCYFGNEIIFQSNQMSCEIFKSEWYLMDKSMKSNIKIMLTRVQKPIVISIGRFVPLSLETFGTILKASYSYYAFLRKVSKE